MGGVHSLEADGWFGVGVSGACWGHMVGVDHEHAHFLQMLTHFLASYNGRVPIASASSPNLNKPCSRQHPKAQASLHSGFTLAKEPHLTTSNKTYLPKKKEKKR